MKRMICIAWGGMPAYAVGAVRAFLRTCRDEVRLVATPSDVPRTCPDEIDGVSIDWVADHDSRTLSEVLGREPDVLFVSGWFIPSFNRFAAEVRAAGGKVVVGVDNRYVPGLRGFVWSIYFRLKVRPLFDAFLVVGRSGLRLLRRGGVPERILGRGFYSADPERFTAGSPLSGRERKVIFVGRYDVRKNILPFARVFSAFRRRHPDWTLECYGQGPLEGELRALGGGVTVFSFLQPDELAAKYRTARVMVLPSLEDHWGVVVHEAALSGCALLLSREVGAAEDFPGAVTFDPQREATMADALERMSGWTDAAWASAERASLGAAGAISPELFAHELLRLSGVRKGRMKVLHVVPSLHRNGGGTSEYVPMVAMAQLRAGLETAIAFYGGGELSEKAKEAERAGVRLIRFEGLRTRSNPIAFSRDLVRRFETAAREFDVVQTHVQWMFPTWWAAHVSRRLGKPYVMMPHGSFAPERLRVSAWKKRLVGWLDRRCARHAKEIWVTSENEAEGVRAYVPGVKTVVLPIGLDVEKYKVEKRGKGEGCGGGERTLLYLSRISPIKGLDLLAEAWGRVVGCASTASEEARCRSLTGRELAEFRSSQWLSGVTDETFERSLQNVFSEKSASGEYRFRSEDERKDAFEGACRFFNEFSRKIIRLSDGRCVYFSPDSRSRMRNAGDLSRCWAEYAFHAVSSSGRRLEGKAYCERLFNREKLEAVSLIADVLEKECCGAMLLDKQREKDAVVFRGVNSKKRRLEIITRVDYAGTGVHNLFEVTVLIKNVQKKSPPTKPLSEVVETVERHQGAGYLPPTEGIIANCFDKDKRDWHLLIVGPDDRGYTEEIKKVFAAKCPEGSYEFCGPVYGEEKFKLLASADAFVLPTRNENWGIAVAEAMASGLPVVCTKGAPWSCLETEKAGWWCEVSVEGVEMAIRELMSLPDAELMAMGANGRQWVGANLDWTKIGMRMKSAYEREAAG